MVKLEALQSFPYGVRSLSAHDTFEASEQDAEVLVKVGRAKRADDEPQKSRYRRKDMRAEH